LLPLGIILSCDYTLTPVDKIVVVVVVVVVVVEGLGGGGGDED